MLEYIALMVIIFGAFIVFRPYLNRSFFGRLKTVGDSFGQGRQFDPGKTKECAFDFLFTDRWYDVTLYEDNECAAKCPKGSGCQTCIVKSSTDFCNQ